MEGWNCGILETSCRLKTEKLKIANCKLQIAKCKNTLIIKCNLQYKTEE